MIARRPENKPRIIQVPLDETFRRVPHRISAVPQREVGCLTRHPVAIAGVHPGTRHLQSCGCIPPTKTVTGDLISTRPEQLLSYW